MKRLVLPMVLTALTFVVVDASARPRRHNNGPRNVPELSVVGAGSALVLLLGGALVAAGRRRKSASDS